VTKRDAERVTRRALRDGFQNAEIRPWGTGWKVVLLRAGQAVGGVTIYDYREYEWENWLEGRKK
jgi:hypothetical protein